MNVLVACEFSGVVRDAFTKKGHYAMSCDLLPTESPGPHYQGDIRDVLHGEWDMMIAHPPCTYLSNSGVRWLYNGGRKENGRDQERWNDMGWAAGFFMALWETDHIPKICIENPVPHGYAGLPPFTQSVQPWQFGHGEIKRTCFWLRGLPELVPTEIVEGREARVHRSSPGPDRWKERSVTLPGIAAAMADQWGSVQCATTNGQVMDR